MNVISPRSAALILKHLDCIDIAMSKQMLRNSPPGETALTSAFAAFFDDMAQEEYRLPYTIVNLNDDLLAADALINISFDVKTHEYDSNVERWVTQSDLGVILNYRDYFEQSNSWSRCILLQAKRVTPDSVNPVTYSESSRFKAYKANQHDRMSTLADWLNSNVVHYLAYCPRPSQLPPILRSRLAYYRYTNDGVRRERPIIHDIFDFTMGLEAHRSLMETESDLAASVFVVHRAQPPRQFKGIHQQFFSSSVPFSWFIICHLVPDRVGCPVPFPSVPLDPYGGPPPPDLTGQPDDLWAHALIQGNPQVVGHVAEMFGAELGRNFQFAVPSTLTIDVHVGPPPHADNIEGLER